MNTIVKTVFGSHMYGLNTPKSDKDFKGVFIPSMRDVLLNRIPETVKIHAGPEHSKNGPEDLDEDMYSLHYFLQLACEGQSVAIDMLHGNMEISSSPYWEFLKEHRNLFYTKSMKAFVGYARKQAAKYGIKGSRLETVRQVLALLVAKGIRLYGSLKTNYGRMNIAVLIKNGICGSYAEKASP